MTDRQRLATPEPGAVWFAGSQSWGGVVAVPNTMELFWVRPMRIPPLRRLLARRVLGAGGQRDWW
ncbi:MULTISPECIES: hypothetical protein [unclassified Pseudofrankia]|uniref:hypothetical protein n=1 Tax=unclassified Pseudofrankia TaxID=2994372 RepID=UPI0008D8FD3E|nr:MULTISPECIES: hypothetical protein [unclassified Pseudofrankia]MDT3445444.1 hypothetical protein [Pseudofrankia sp. BMG5.37]OHV67517.1 hypothetical protein BCD48_35350 [Pseudofrankia sp. BMG5.36]